MKISVVINTFNAEKHLEEVLNSVKEMPRIEGFYTGIESTGFSWTQGNLFPITIEDFKFDKNEIGINLKIGK